MGVLACIQFNALLRPLGATCFFHLVVVSLLHQDVISLRSSLVTISGKSYKKKVSGHTAEAGPKTENDSHHLQPSFF